MNNQQNTSIIQSFPLPQVILPTTAHRNTMIMVHGRGSDGKDFAEDLFNAEAITGETLQQRLPGTKWIFHMAHWRQSTFWKFQMKEWFDLWSVEDLTLREGLQVNGLYESILYIRNIIDEEIQSGTPPENIILGGISQGYATAIHVLLSGQHQLGGFIGVSGWIPFRTNLRAGDDNLRCFYMEKLNTAATTTEATLRTPVLTMHSTDDNVVNVKYGRNARMTLLDLGMEVEYKEYNQGEHWLFNSQGHDDINGIRSISF